MEKRPGFRPRPPKLKDDGTLKNIFGNPEVAESNGQVSFDEVVRYLQRKWAGKISELGFLEVSKLFQRDLIRFAISACGSVEGASKILGIGRTSLWERITNNAEDLRFYEEARRDKKMVLRCSRCKALNILGSRLYTYSPSYCSKCSALLQYQSSKDCL